MTHRSCPLPQVEDALSPYLRARQDALRIRKALAEHFQAQFPGAESAVTPLGLPFPPSVPESKSAPPALTGLRRQYWEAVQAHAAARKRRDALNAELHELRESHIRAKTSPDELVFSAAPPLGAGDNHDAANYIALLHQRRRHRKLQILHDALDQIADTEPHPLRRDLHQWLKTKLGDAPIPPPDITAAEDAAAALPDDAPVQDQVLRLKKELLHAKQTVDAEKALSSAAQLQLDGATPRTIEGQVVALRAARDELIAWIEGELAKLAENDESQLSHGTPQRHGLIDRDAAADRAASDVPYQEQVDVLYERYVTARASMIAAVEAATAAAKDISTVPFMPSSQKAPPSSVSDQSPDTKTLPTLDVLPYISALIQSAQDERALMQQTSYLRHRLLRSQEEARNMMQRLASESHMVPPGADGGLAWAHAARHAGKEADKAVTEQLQAGEANIAGAKQILQELDKRREVFARLRVEF